VTTGGNVTTTTSGVTGGGSTGLTTGGGSATGGVATVAKKAAEAITNIAGAFDNFTSGTTTLAGIEAASNQLVFVMARQALTPTPLRESWRRLPVQA
jgi:hypothetical protein